MLEFLVGFQQPNYKKRQTILSVLLLIGSSNSRGKQRQMTCFEQNTFEAGAGWPFLPFRAVLAVTTPTQAQG